MNLRVDLILEAEQRSASFFNFKTVTRLVSILIPVLIVLFYIISFGGYLALKGKAKQLETELDIKQPKVAKADSLSGEVAVNEKMRKELLGWRNSTIDWHRQLVELMKATPSEMYFESLRVMQAFQVEGNVPARAFSAVIAGKSQGDRSVDNVQLMKRNLTISEFFQKYMNPPEVPVFKQDETPGAKKTDRIFRMECNYKTRKMQ